jgi:prepilin-type processing-associated H-X9-DG protein
VIAIIGILVGMLLPAVQQVREAARNANCQSNLRNVGIAIINHQTGKQRFPLGAKGLTANSGNTNTQIATGWTTAILPFLEQQAAFDQLLDASAGAMDEAALVNALTDTSIVPDLPILLCPSSAQPDRLASDLTYVGATTHYYGVSGPGSDGIGIDHYTLPEQDPVANDVATRNRIGMDGIFSPFSPIKRDAAKGATNVARFYKNNRAKTDSDIRDGLSNTLMAGEVSRSEGENSNGSRIVSHRTGWVFGGVGQTFDNGTSFNPDIQFAAKTIVVGLNERPPSNGTDVNYANMQNLAGTTNPSAPRATNSHSFNSNHAGGINFLFGDGHIDTLDAEADVITLKALASINGRETASADDF